MSSPLLSVVCRDLLFMEVGLVNLHGLELFVLILLVKEPGWHDGVASHLFSFNLLTHLNVFGLILKQLAGKNRLPHYLLLSNWALSLEVNDIVMLRGLKDSCLEHLLILGLVAARVRVNIV